MGSIADPSSHKILNDEEITVLITGFAPFKSTYPVNPSWEIAKALPPFLPPATIKSAVSSKPRSPTVRLLVHPAPIRVSYSVVRDFHVPWATQSPKIDFVVHLGMATGRRWYSVERGAHRDGYYVPDVDGEVLGDETEKEDWVWAGCPERLDSAIDVDRVLELWRTRLPELDLRISNDAGRYLCDFIYYSTLAELWKDERKRRVLFLHVPPASDEAAIETGVVVLEELVRAMVKTWSEKEEKSPEDATEKDQS